MKIIILAGGLGTRMGQLTELIPKPMVNIGNKPILWHIMKIYSSHGINDFIICCGYKGYVIKEYFANYFLHQSDITFCLKDNTMNVHKKGAEPWTVTLIDTGDSTMTGGRLKRVAKYIEDEDDFCFTYGDGVANIDISSLISFHKSHGRVATLTSVYPPGRFGALKVDGNRVLEFTEKPQEGGALINGGFFVLSPSVLKHINDDSCVFEQEPLKELAKSGQLMTFVHKGFFQPMDTMRDRKYLQDLWDSGDAPWHVWK